MEDSEIIIGFSRPRDNRIPIFSWLIRLIEGTEYSHVYIKWYSGFVDRYIIYQASGSMVHFIGHTLFKKHAQPVEEYAIDIKQSTKKEFIQWCLDHAGIHYGVKHIIGMAWVRFVGLFGKKIRNPLSGKEQVCSKIVGEALRDVLDIKIKKDLETAGPKAINEIVRKIPGIEVVDTSVMGAVTSNEVKYRYRREIPDSVDKDFVEVRKIIKELQSQ